MDKSSDVILKPPNITLWLNMTEFQKALWMVDEVEARWRRFLKAYSELNRIEVLWGKSIMYSIESAVMQISSSIGIPFNSSLRLKPIRPHAGEITERVHDDVELIRQDKEYKRLMGHGNGDTLP